MAPAIAPAPARPAVPLSTRRGIGHMKLTLLGARGKEEATAEPLCGLEGASSVKMCSAGCAGSLQSSAGSSSPSRSTSPSCTSEPDPRVEARPTSLPICQMGYSVHEVVGLGSMAVVYRVAHLGGGQAFAAKRVRHADGEHRSAVIEEHRIMQGLDHENVLRSRALYEFPTELWLCTELCAEGTVHARVGRRGAFADGRCRALARQLVDATEYLHRRRIVHRDIKPENLFLGGGASQLKVGDFNSAVKLGSKAAGPGSVWMLSMRGTPLYAAPELRFDLDWNERVDVWTVGLSVYYMARAAAPFNVCHWQAVEALRGGRLPHIAWQGMSAAMADLVRQCLVVDMRDRPTAMELLLHPALEAVPGNRSGEAAGLPALSKSSRGPVVRSSCGLLFGSASAQRPPPAVEKDWRRTALRTLASKCFRVSERLVTLGAMDPWTL